MSEVNNEKLHIRLHVYDEEIEVTIKRSDEEFYRQPNSSPTVITPTLRLIKVRRASIRLRS